MASEISISAISGISMMVQLYSGSLPVGSPFSATEIGLTGIYVADMPIVPYGRYIVQAYAGDAAIASGEIMWSGQYELMESMGNFRGLNPNAPWTITPTGEDAGGENLAITGDGTNESIVTKQ